MFSKEVRGSETWAALRPLQACELFSKVGQRPLESSSSQQQASLPRRAAQ